MPERSSLGELHDLRVLLHDVEMFIDERHTSKADDPACVACDLVVRLRKTNAALAKAEAGQPCVLLDRYEVGLAIDAVAKMVPDSRPWPHRPLLRKLQDGYRKGIERA